MRKFIIDTDTASDDAAALMLAALSPDVEILGVTTLTGNVDIEQSARNALATLEACGSAVPVYKGALRPLFREREETISIHGADGMGDCDLIHPKGAAQDKRAVDFILETVAAHPGEIELIVLGPATNIALAILQDRETMSKVKHIWSMGTPGFGAGNASPVAEFNVFIDAEAYKIMLDSGLPVTILGFDMCLGESCFTSSEVDQIASKQGTPGEFLMKGAAKLIEFNIATRGKRQADFCDSVAMAIAVWDDCLEEAVNCYGYTCTMDGPLYGQVVFYREDATYESSPHVPYYNARVVTKVNTELYKSRFIELLAHECVKSA